MLKYLRMFTKSKIFLSRVQLYYSVNWLKHCILILKFPYPIAKQLPVCFLWKSKIHFNNGFNPEGVDSKGMIGLDNLLKLNTCFTGYAEITILGTHFLRSIQLGKDYFIIYWWNGLCELGHMASLASNAKWFV
jgi:hypothetical protein